MNNTNWKQQLLFTTAIAGTLIGLITGYLLIRSAEEKGDAPPKISTTDAIRLAVTTVGFVRSIAALNDGK